MLKKKANFQNSIQVPGGGRKGGPKTEKPHRNTPKKPQTASDFFPNTETARTWRPQYEADVSKTCDIIIIIITAIIIIIIIIIVPI